MSGLPAAADARRPLKLLHLEDSPSDHERALLELARAGLRVDARRVETEAELRACLDEGGWDVVLSDHELPGYGGAQALSLVREHAPDLPFVLLSGQIGEAGAVAAMRSGVSDYVVKDQIARLAPAVARAVAAAEEHRARLAADAALAESRARLSELAQHLQTSIERERAAIAREIHDDVGGSLAAIRFDLAWIARHEQSPEVQLRVASALETVAHAVEASQRIMHDLRPAILDQGLVAALQWMAGQFERRNGVSCLFRCRHEQVALPAGVPLVAYRFAQEALTNVTKHAQASEVTIDLSLTRGVLSLEIADNGRGMAEGDLAKTGSFGLRGLHERAGTVGGWVEVSSSASGTTLLLSVPVGGEGKRFDADDDHDPSGWGGVPE